jgi:circadian clock protein KaiB
LTPSERKTEEFERALAKADVVEVVLRLFVAGMGPRSTRAVADVKRICEAIGALCSVQIVDIYQQPEEAAAAQIVAVPTLVRDRPLPQRKVIGAIDDVERVVRGLRVIPLPTLETG